MSKEALKKPLKRPDQLRAVWNALVKIPKVLEKTWKDLERLGKDFQEKLSTESFLLYNRDKYICQWRLQ